MDPVLSKFKGLIGGMPGYSITVDPPHGSDGSWFIDVRRGKKRLTVEYRENRGFGLFERNASYGERPSETYQTPDMAVRRARQIMESSSRKPSRLTVKDLRELRACSQVKLAKKLGVKQSAVSRFEKRNDVKLATLAAAVKALGGELQVRVRFPNAEVPLSIKD
jgi:DNA-binding XRE family transcriptional regulator